MKKEKLLFSTDIDIMFPDEDDRKAMYHDFCAINEIEPSEDDMYEYLASEIDWMLGDLYCEIETYERTHGAKSYVVLADLGLWNGRYDGGKVINGLWNTISQTLEDYSTIKLVGKRLKVSAVHHDGTNYYEIRELTDKGTQYMERHEYDMSDRELHTKLFNDSHYSHEVSMFKEIYGI